MQDKILQAKYKGLLKNPPNSTDNTKTNMAADEVALRPMVINAGRGTAVLRIVEPGTNRIVTLLQDKGLRIKV